VKSDLETSPSTKMEANILLWIAGNLIVPLSFNTLFFNFVILVIIISNYDDDYVDDAV